MKIAIDAVGVRGHGAAAVLSELLHWLPISRPEWEWHVFLFERYLREFDDPIVSEKVTLENVSYGNSGLQRMQWVNHHLPAKLRNAKADVLFSFANIAPAHPTIPQVVLCHQPLAFFAEGIPSYAILSRVRLWFMRLQILRGALASRAMIVQTNAMRERIEQMEPRLKGRIQVIPSGYRTPSEQPVVREHVRLAVETASHPRLIYVSHPWRHKNHLALVKALPLIREALPGARMLFTLDRDQSRIPHYKEYIEMLLDKADQLGIAERIIWLGCLSHDEVGYALGRSDLMVFPSLAESFGLGQVEAMAAGCPVAAADLPYAHDVCGDAAVFFDPHSPQSISEVVVSICSNSMAKNQLSISGKIWTKRFSYKTISEEVSTRLELAVNQIK